MSVRGLVRSTHYYATVEAHHDWAWLAAWAAAHGYKDQAERLTPKADAGHRTVDKSINALMALMGQPGPLYKFRERVTSDNAVLADEQAEVLT